jgi:hypothetical protein
MPEEIAKHIISQMTWLEPGRYKMIDTPPFLVRQEHPSQKINEPLPIPMHNEKSLSTPPPIKTPPPVPKDQLTIRDFFPPLKK